MAQHIALYRMWRPQSFREIAGQKHIIQTLQNALREGRSSHAYLFSGPRGTGKTTAAKILAKAVNCEKGPAAEPCNECAVCQRITEGTVVDVVEIDAASNRGVDEIREIRDKVKYAPTEVRRKIYIIDEVHMLTTEAFNALLKTLEEPPAHVMFILATTEPHKIPATIISRCQRFDFRRVSLGEQMARLEHICREENIQVDEDALQYIARLSDGGMRDALSLLDQIVSYSGSRVSYGDVIAVTGGLASEQFGRLAQAIKEGNAADALDLIDDFMQEGKSAEKCVESLVQYFRDILMVRMIPGSKVVTERIFHTDEYVRMSDGFTTDQLFYMIERLTAYQADMKYSSQPQTLLEIAVIKLCGDAPAAAPAAHSEPLAETSKDIVAPLLRRIEKLEEKLAKLSQGAVVQEPGSARSSAAAGSRTASSAVSRRSGVKLEPFVQSKDETLTRSVLNKWTAVLGQVKEKKVQVHAWLINGEPVSCSGDTVLVAFKNLIHRDTTDKPENKQLIEQVLSDTIGRPLKLTAVMINEWNAMQPGADSAQQEPMQLIPEEPTSAGSANPEHVDKALELFGEHLVTIKD